jgi:hypothetical protein
MQRKMASRCEWIFTAPMTLACSSSMINIELSNSTSVYVKLTDCIWSGDYADPRNYDPDRRRRNSVVSTDSTPELSSGSRLPRSRCMQPYF